MERCLFVIRTATERERAFAAEKAYARTQLAVVADPTSHWASE